MKFDILHNFISPQTGNLSGRPFSIFFASKVNKNTGDWVSKPSPILMDMRFDIFENKSLISKNKTNHENLRNVDFITRTKSEVTPNAFALNTLKTGLLKHTGDGNINIATAGLDITKDDYIDPKSLKESNEALLFKANMYADQVGAATLVEANSFTELETSKTLIEANAFATNVGINTLIAAKDYVDNKEIQISGDVIGSGKINEKINVKFIKNAEFLGDFISVPAIIKISSLTTIPDVDSCLFLQQIKMV